MKPQSIHPACSLLALTLEMAPAIAIAALLGACASPNPAAPRDGRPGSLAPEAARITDITIARDRLVISALAERQAKLAGEVRTPQRSHALARAGCWIAAGEHQYARNDRSGFPEAALAQAGALLAALESGAPLPAPALWRAPRLREDLWRRAALVERAARAEPAEADIGDAGLACAAESLACAEVDLVHGDDQYARFGWHAAREHVARAEQRIDRAERCIDRAEREASACASAAATAATPAAAAFAAPVGAPVTRKFVLQADALFHFGESALAHLRPEKNAELDALAAQITRLKAIERVRIVGHTDRLGGDDSNRRLSLARASTIAATLAARGVPAAAMSVEGRGAADAIAGCENSAARAHTIACLAPNRRVEIEVLGVGP